MNSNNAPYLEVKGKVKGKAYPRTGHEDQEGTEKCRMFQKELYNFESL